MSYDIITNVQCFDANIDKEIINDERNDEQSQI